MSIFEVAADNLFSASLYKGANAEASAQRALERGLQAFIKKDYAAARQSLQQAVGLSPRSGTTINALDYMARSYLAEGDTRSATETYKQSLRIANRDDTRIALGNIYFSQDQISEARAEYEQAVNLNPNAPNRYSLAQGYLAEARYDRAEAQFKLVQQLSPREAQGAYGLGLTYAKQGRYEDALDALDRAIAVDPTYLEAYAEKGYAYMDMGDTAKAEEMLSFLQSKSASQADTLESYIYDKAAPRMTAAFDGDVFASFPTPLKAGTQISLLGPNLSSPGGTQTFSVVFQFSKEMDMDSVQNVNNWRIERQPTTGRGDGYNFGYKPPETEIDVPNAPLAVYYDTQFKTATVLFKLQQNAEVNGTIDPSHIQFSFKGVDANGLSMDSDADQFTGFSGFA